MLPNEIERILNEELKKNPLTTIPLQYYYPTAKIRKGNRPRTVRPCAWLKDGKCQIVLKGSTECDKPRMQGCAFKVLTGGRQIDYDRTLRLLTTHRANLGAWTFEGRYHPRGIYVFNSLGIPHDPSLGNINYG